MAPMGLGRVEVMRWCGGRERQLAGLAGGGRRRLRRQRRGGTVRLGNRRRRLTLRRLVRWSQVRWRVVVEFLGPIKKAVMEIATGRQLVESPDLSMRFIYSFPFPLA